MAAVRKAIRARRRRAADHVRQVDRRADGPVDRAGPHDRAARRGVRRASRSRSPPSACTACCRTASRAAPAKSRSASRSARQPGRVIAMILRETARTRRRRAGTGRGPGLRGVALDRQPAVRRRSAGSAHAGAGDRAAAVGGAQRGVLAGAAGVETGSDGGAASGVKSKRALFRSLVQVRHDKILTQRDAKIRRDRRLDPGAAFG